MKNSSFTRRRLLRGMLQGTGVGVGLPLLDLFLNDNGTAMADGSKLPVCFGTWFWGLGLSLVEWAPEKTGRDYQLPTHLQVFEPIQDKINLYSGTDLFTDGASGVHKGGPEGQMTGTVSSKKGYQQSIDSLIAEQLGVRTRFRSIEVSCDGNPATSWSARSTNAMNPAEVSPLSLYQRIFVHGFQDPNAATFTPNPDIMLRKSALSVVKDEREALVKHIGANDKTRLDEFFTSLREMEQRLTLELEKPEPMKACSVPGAPENEHPGVLVDDSLAVHRQFADLIGHALACGQTQIFNVAFSIDGVKRGDPSSHHTYSHEEALDPQLGYQPMTHWFAMEYMKAFRDMVQALDGIKEGDGTLLDRTLVMAYTDHGDARLHLLQKMPSFTAGGAGGGMKTGYHIAGADGDSTMRVGLTCLQALGLPVARWGTGSNRVTNPFTEVLA